MKSLIIKIIEIVGNCPVYKIGDKIVLDEGYKINLQKTSSICMHSLASIFPYYVALSNDVDPDNLGLTKKKNYKRYDDIHKSNQDKNNVGNNNNTIKGEGKSAFVQCLDPCKYTGGGTVVFEIKKIDWYILKNFINLYL